MHYCEWMWYAWTCNQRPLEAVEGQDMTRSRDCVIQIHHVHTFVYARGSIELAYDNFNLVVPSLRWVGVMTIDLENCEHKLTE